MTLGSGEMKTLSLSFIPRYPHDSGFSGAPQLSSYESVDFKDLVGDDIMGQRNSFDYTNVKDNENEYEVRTRVVFQTSRGQVILPVTASSVRYNDYHMPERIQFFSSSSIFDDTIMYKAVDRYFDFWDQEEVKEDTCFELFLRNPRSEQLVVHKAVISRPDFVTLNDRMADPDFISSKPTMIWGEEGFPIGPVGIGYIGTVCPRGSKESHPDMGFDPPIDSSWILEDEKVDISLGYLLIQTDADTLIIWLERYVEMRKYDMTSKRRKSVSSRSLEKRERNKKGKMTAVPEPLTDYVVPQVRTKRLTHIPIKNDSTETIKIMRLAIVLDKPGEKVLEQGRMFLSISSRRMECRTPDPKNPGVNEEIIAECENLEVIPAGKTVGEAIQFEYGFKDNEPNSYFNRELQSNRISGTIVIRATTYDEITFTDWKKRIVTNLKNSNGENIDTDLVLEIPFELKVIGNQLKAVTDGSSVLTDYLKLEGKENEVKAFFFPFTAYDMRLWNVWRGVRGRDYEYDRSGIAHSLRIVGFTHEHLNLTNLGLESDNDDPNSHLCERFYAALGKPKDNQNGSFRDLGHIALSYDYDVHRDFSHRGVMRPVVCYLTYNTYPIDTGDHSIMLVIFPGNLELSASIQGVDIKTSSSASRFESVSSFSSTIRPGMKNVEDWFLETTSGKALEKYLKRFTARHLNGTDLLKDYLYNIADVGEEEVDLVDPIVVNVGAIARGDKKETPIYVTNHNPVPIQLFMDRSEVEGLSISVMRDGSHTAGEGNYVLDYLPKNKRDSKVERGRWKGHNREALRRFIETNEYASIFFLSFMHRDIVKPNPHAMKRLPFLKELYKLRAKADFNMDSFSFSFFNEENSACAGEYQHPAIYNKFNTTFGTPYYGPTLISDDLRTIHHLVSCEPTIRNGVPVKDLTNLRQAPVTIPPGGTLQLTLRTRAPDTEFLEKDITKLIGTGLVLSTDHGQIIPIVVTYEALLGQLAVSPNPSWRRSFRQWQHMEAKYVHYYYGTVLQVPSTYFVDESLELTGTDTTNKFNTRLRVEPSGGLPNNENLITYLSPFGANETDLYLASSFSRDVIVRKIENCNPWFQVELHDEPRGSESFTQQSTEKPDGQTLKVINVGKLRTTIPCPSFEELVNSGKLHVTLPVGPQRFPSFYQCALEWIRSRTQIQVEDCGLESMQKIHDDSEYASDDAAIERATKALNRAISFTFYKYNSLYLKDLAVAQPYGARSAGQTQGFADYALDGFGASLKAGASKRTEVLDRVTVDVFAEVSDAWRVVSELDLHTMSTTLRATIEYEYSGDFKNTSSPGDLTDEGSCAATPQSLTVPLQDMFMRSYISIPRLVKSRNEMKNHTADPFEQNFFDTDFHSVVNFPATPVAETISIMVPLENPTPHPVKVKLAAVTWETDIHNSGAQDVNVEQDRVRDHYMSRFESIYPQTGNNNAENTRGEAWWDGPGGFYQSDDKGNLIQSRHNETIPTADETHVSLENPSLFSHSSFIVGCGPRCGQRDETSYKFDHVMKDSSPIGAAAAAGFSLVGKARQGEEDEDGYYDDGKYDAYLSPGAEAITEDAPAAFGLPYSAFDEIVLPPFSTGEVGPVLFRPPGRYSVVGCDAVHESGSGDWRTETVTMCGSKVFETLVFLENSLTGLERVMLRGEALWERVVFFDEARDEDVRSQFSDLEYRYGRSALIFPGTSVRYRPQKIRSENEAALKGTHPILKTIRVANIGDIAVEYSRMYLTGSSPPNAFASSSKKQSSSIGRIQRCSHRGFTLYGCHESDELTFTNKEGELMENLRHGFKLEPNETMSITIQHAPDCIYKKEFISLRIIRKRSKRRRRRATLHRSGQQGGRSNRKGHKLEPTFKQNDLELLIGYDMNDEEAAECIPYSAYRGGEPIFVLGTDNISKWNAIQNQDEVDLIFRKIQMGIRHRKDHLVPLLTAVISSQYGFWLSLCVCSALVFLAGWTQVRFRSRASKRFLRMLKNFGGRLSTSSQQTQNKWAGAFRCLARLNPTATELQTIGKEQNRFIVLPRLKNNGVLNPQCINSSGVFQRDRPQSVYGVHSRAGGEGSVGSGAEKNHFLSDTLFRDAIVKNTSREDKYFVPCGLGAKAAMSRGMINRSLKPKLVLKSKLLFEQRRSAQRAPTQSAQSRNYVPTTKTKDRMCDEPSIAPIITSDEDSTEESNGTQKKSSTFSKASFPLDPNPIPTQKGRSNGQVDDSNNGSTNGTLGKPRTNNANKKDISKNMHLSKSKNEEWIDLQPSESGLNQELQHSTATLLSNQTKARARNKNSVPPKTKSGKAENSLQSARQASCDITVSSEDSSSITSFTRDSKSREKKQGTKNKVKRTLSAKIQAEQGGAKAATKTQKKRKKPKERKISAVPHSPSSIRSNMSNISTRTESTTSSIEKLPTVQSLCSEDPHSPRLRPPPGLPPPPGFGSFGATSDLRSTLSPPVLAELPEGNVSIASLLSPVESLPPPTDLSDDTGTALGQLYSATGNDTPTNHELESSTASLFNTIRAFDENALDVRGNSSTLSIDALSELRVAVTNPATPEIYHIEPPSISGGENQFLSSRSPSAFNIMDFLDNILEESHTSDGGEPADGVVDLVREDEDVPSLPLLSDPWGVPETNRASRATAYGIAVEGDDGDMPGNDGDLSGDNGEVETSNEIVQAVLSSLPLQHGDNISVLSPAAAILPAGTSVFDDDHEGEEDGDDYNNEDFYAKLLG